MTVKELIAALADCNPEHQVYYYDDDLREVGGVRTEPYQGGGPDCVIVDKKPWKPPFTAEEFAACKEKRFTKETT